MRKTTSFLALCFVVALAACNSNNSSPNPNPTPLPTPTNNCTLPASVVAASGFSVHCFAASPSGSTNPDSIVQIGRSVFVGYGDDVNPDGTAGPSGKTTNEIVQYDLSGNLQKTYSVPGHNDGLMAFNSTTLWAMSNEDANPVLTVINLSSGSTAQYKPQSSFSGGLPHGGGIDDMVMINGNVYVSASNPTTSSTAMCPANSSTPGCPNGISTSPFVYILTLNSDGVTFNLTNVASSETVGTNIATSAAATINATDPDSEVISTDGSTLIVDSQQDAELVYVANLSSTPTVSFLPITLNGTPQQLDDTRFAPSGLTFCLDADKGGQTIYRIDGSFGAGSAYSSGQTAVLQVNTSTGAATSIVSGMTSPHGMVFVTLM